MITLRIDSPPAVVYCDTVAEAAALLGLMLTGLPKDKLVVSAPRLAMQARTEPEPQEAERPVVAPPSSPQPPKRPAAEQQLQSALGRLATQARTEPELPKAKAPQPITRSGADRPEWMPAVVLSASGKVRGSGSAVVAAFKRDQSFSIPELARHIYGASTGQSVAKVKKTIENLIAAGYLKRLGVTTFRVLKEPT